MASGYPGTSSPSNMPTAAREELESDHSHPSIPQAAVTEAGRSFGMPSTVAGSSPARRQATQDSYERGMAQGAGASPSDLERGFGRNPGDRGAMPETATGPTSSFSPAGLGSQTPLPAPALIISRPSSGYDAPPPPRRLNSQGSRRSGDPFAGSPDGSPTHTNVHLAPGYNNLHGPNDGRLPQRNADDEGRGARLRHVLEAERDDLFDRVVGTNVGGESDHVLGARLRQFLGEERDRFIEKIPGAYPSNADNGAHRSRPHTVYADEEKNASYLPEGANQPQAGGRGADEGIATRLRHATQDYLHEHLPAIEDIRSRMSRATAPVQSMIDYVVPVAGEAPAETEPERQYLPGSVGSRLSVTTKNAKSERDKYAAKARFTGLALNIAIGLQVLLGSLTTGLSAVATQGKQAAVATTILGALATLVASYLARARGSNEPELSITRVKDLEQFLRECTNFKMDHGEDMTSKYDAEIEMYRTRFEGLLGNGNGERRLSPTGGALQATVGS